MNIETLKFGFQILQFLLTAGVGFYVYMSNKDKVTNERISKIEKTIDEKLDQHGERISKLEVHTQQAPTHKDLADIHEKINEVSGCVSRIEGEFVGSKHTLHLIHDFLMKGGRK